MALELENFADEQLDSEYVAYLLDQQSPENHERYGRLWNYFRNPLAPAVGVAAGAMNSSSRPYFQAQEVGLPARITGVERTGAGGERPTDLRRKEVVIENDIAWRIGTMIDYLFGKAPTIRSLAADAHLAGIIEKAIGALLEANGGVSFLQEMAPFGAVYGFVDVALRLPAGGLEGRSLLPADETGQADAQDAGYRRGTAVSGVRPEETKHNNGDPMLTHGASTTATAGETPAPRSTAANAAAVEYMRRLQLEAIEAPRVLPILDPYDYRRVRVWMQKFHTHPARLADRRPGWRRFFGGSRAAAPATVEVVEIISAAWWQRYEDRELAAEGPNDLGCLPIVHAQNIALCGSYAGLSDVEPLVPLQDELNTRLSDRAQRVTYQSFKMYLGKGIDDFLERPVGPGQMWATQNMEASIEEFGSDSGSPSEDVHVEQVRAALDKVSGVTPLAAGLIRGNVGYLSSATALKVLLSGLISRTTRKRLAYGAAIGQIVELALAWLDRTGVLKTTPADRRIEIHWPSALPADEGEQLRNAQIKAQLGVPAEQVLAELGYARNVTDAQ